MIDIERIKIMTKLAGYEKGQGKKDIAMNQYSRQDYVRYQTMQSSIFATISFGIICFIFLLWGLEWFLDLSGIVSYLSVLAVLFVIYVIFIWIYRRFLKKIYGKRYTEMTLRLEAYRRDLIRLERMYGEMEKKTVSSTEVMNKKE